MSRVRTIKLMFSLCSNRFSIIFFFYSFPQLKAVIVDAKLEVLVQAEVKFDSDLPEFRTTGGVNTGKNRNE